MCMWQKNLKDKGKCGQRQKETKIKEKLIEILYSLSSRPLEGRRFFFFYFFPTIHPILLSSQISLGPLQLLELTEHVVKCWYSPVALLCGSGWNEPWQKYSKLASLALRSSNWMYIINLLKFQNNLLCLLVIICLFMCFMILLPWSYFLESRYKFLKLGLKELSWVGCLS